MLRMNSSIRDWSEAEWTTPRRRWRVLKGGIFGDVDIEGPIHGYYVDLGVVGEGVDSVGLETDEEVIVDLTFGEGLIMGKSQGGGCAGEL